MLTFTCTPSQSCKSNSVITMSVLSLSGVNSSESFINGPMDAVIHQPTLEIKNTSKSQNVNTSDSPDEEVDSMAERFNPIIYCSLIAVVTTVGVVGNVFILVIFSDKGNKKRSFSVYLRALAVSDSLVLISLLVDDVITRLVDIDILYGNREICSAYLLWNAVWSQFSAGLLILVALDRYIAVAYPLKRIFVCTYKRSVYITLATALSCVALLIYQVICNEVETKYRENDVNWEYDCPAMDSNEYKLITYVYSLLFLAIIPFVVVLVLNLRVLYLFKTSLGVKQAKGSVSLVWVTLPIISVTVSSALLIFPAILIEIVEMVIGWIDISPEIQENIDKAWDIANVIRLLNHATNFYVLVLFTKKYRSTLKNGCCCLKPRSNQVFLTISGTQDQNVNTHMP